MLFNKLTYKKPFKANLKSIKLKLLKLQVINKYVKDIKVKKQKKPKNF